MAVNYMEKVKKGHLYEIYHNIWLKGNGDNRVFSISREPYQDVGKLHKIRLFGICIHFVYILYTDLCTFCIHSIV